MKQDITVNRVLRDLKQKGLISKDITGAVRDEETKIYANALYVAGWEEKGRLHGDRRSKEVIQMTAGGKEMQSFHNTIHAAKALKCSRVPIRRSLLTGEPTSRGHIWKYKEDEKGNDRDTDTGRKG